MMVYSMEYSNNFVYDAERLNKAERNEPFHDIFNPDLMQNQLNTLLRNRYP